MDYNQVDLDDLIEMGSYFSYNSNTFMHATKKHPTSLTISDEMNQMPPNELYHHFGVPADQSTIYIAHMHEKGTI